MADASCGIRSLEYDISLFHELAESRGLGKTHEQTLRERKRTAGKKPGTVRRMRGQPKRGTAAQGNETGFDGNKKTGGRRRHILTDASGLIFAVIAAAADSGEREGLRHLLADYFAQGARRLRRISADGGYSGMPLYERVLKIKKTWKVILELAEKQGKGFNAAKKRWAAERAFAWLNNFRRAQKIMRF